LLVAGVAAACLVAACADIFGIQGGFLEDASLSDSGSDDTGSGKDVITIGDANFAVCDGGLTTVDPNAIYVSPNGNDLSTCGSQTSPCQTIAFALKNALDAGSFYLRDGLYSEHVLLGARSNVVIQGGWVVDGGVWTQQCSTSLTKIKPDAGSGATLTVTGSTGVVIRLVWIETEDQAGTGESLYAAFVNNYSAVTFDNVLLVSQNAGAGAGGRVGPNGIGCNSFAYDSGANGGPGTPGPLPTFAATGLNTSTAGTGNTGNVGVGTNTGGASCVPNVQCTPGLSPDGGVMCLQTSVGSCCGFPGDPACAGNPGSGGTGGHGGASSVAVFVWGGSVVTLTGGALFTSSGGNGGNGGGGGAGAPGVDGDAGATNKCCANPCSGACSCVPLFESGGPGGTGGDGGSGGQGGGGAGGPTYLIVYGGDASVVLNPPPVMEAGAGGAGGKPNGPVGPAGNVLAQ
jgi:hypothetical protein